MEALRRRSRKEAIAIFVTDEEPIASRILYVNDAFVEMTGYTSEELVGHSAMLLAGRRPSADALRAAREAPKPYVAIERKLRRDGTAYDAEVRLEALPGGHGHVVLLQRELEPVRV